jgi:NADPH:quinone reductase
MRAVIVRQFGDPKLLTIEEVPTPTPGDGEALVEIKAAAINPSDVKNVQGAMHGTTLPRIPGRDFAGTVVRGPAEFVGREVWGTGGDIGFTKDGSHAQYILLPLAALTSKPKNLSTEAAGSAGLTYVTAWSAIVTAADVSKEDLVLIIGAAGGVGSAAVQIAKMRGAKVIGGIRSDEEAARARENGVDAVVNTQSGNVVETLAKSGGADIVFDTTGFMFAEAIEAAATHARICVISAPPDGKSTFNLRSIYRKELRVFGVDTRSLDAVACAKLLAEISPFFTSGQFKATPAKPYPLASAPQAYEQAARGGERIVLLPAL